jgi:hypothetical protein
MKEGRVPLLAGADKPDYICFIVYSWLVLKQVYMRHPEAEKVDFVVSTKNKVT